MYENHHSPRGTKQTSRGGRGFTSERKHNSPADQNKNISQSPNLKLCVGNVMKYNQNKCNPSHLVIIIFSYGFKQFFLSNSLGQFEVQR